MLEVSVDLSRDNDVKKLAIWPSAFGQKQTSECGHLYISQAVRRLSASAAQKREVTFMDRKKSRPATSDWVIRSAQPGSIERIEARFGSHGYNQHRHDTYF